MRKSLLLLVAGFAVLACKSAPHVARGRESGEPMEIGQSWDVCTLVGPQNQRPGIYGTDLGYSVPNPSDGQLAMLFGDSWAAQTDVCAYPVSPADDLQGALPLQRPSVLSVGQPTAAAAQACDSFGYALEDASDPTSWSRIHVYKDPSSRSQDNMLNTGMLRTPVAAWQDGQHVFGAFVRDEATRCKVSTDCPPQMLCSSDPDYPGKHVGACQPNISVIEDADPRYCVTADDCPALNLCNDLDTGRCVAAKPFTVQRDGQSLSPDWYDDDPRRGMALNVYLATALWPDRAADYGTGFRFATNKFINMTARTVTHFDPEHPENNDYSAGTETLLIWGRPAFVTTKGFQAFPFLLYQPLAGLLNEQGLIHWAPRYFAGYSPDGGPQWSDIEADAQPLYGVDENLVQRGGHWAWDWKQPEVDYLEQMSVAWVAPLARWVMLYSGDPPAFAVADPASGEKLPPAHPQAVPGAIYLRSAAHPWGRARVDAPASQAFTPARPVLTRRMMAKYLACDDDAKDHSECGPQRETHDPDDLLRAIGDWTTELTPGDWLNVSAECIAGNTALGVQNSLEDDSSGHLYGANIIEQWTEDVSDRAPGLAERQRAVELYWNVSTWNPYAVQLVKTQLRGTPEQIE
jgi:hypothetical protein